MDEVYKENIKQLDKCREYMKYLGYYLLKLYIKLFIFKNIFIFGFIFKYKVIELKRYTNIIKSSK